MATISVSHKLYLYRLFTAQVGQGRQTMLSRVEEVLLADDIWPCDLGCKDVRDLLESLDDFVRLSVFKKGRVYATVLPQPEWDALLEKAQKTETKPQESGGAKSWRKKRAKKDVVPVKPRPKGRPKPAEPEPEAAEPATAHDTAAEPQAATAHDVEPEPLATPAFEQEAEAATEAEVAAAPAASAAPAPAAVPEVEATSDVEPAATVNAEQVAQTEPAAEPVDATEPEAAPIAHTEPVAVPTPAPAPEPTAAPEPEASLEEPPSISFTITYDPYAEEAVVEGPAAEAAPESAAIPPAPAEPAQIRSAQTSQRSLPASFSHEVACANEHLSALYQILPLDVDPYALLDEDLLVARSTHTLKSANGTVTFPLRYVQGDGGEPVVVALRRTLPTPSGRRWAVTEVRTAPDATLDGLPEATDNTSRELALFAHIGPWDELLDQLGGLLCADDVLGDADVLQTYLGMTLHRILCERKLRVYDDESRAAFDTGLTTPLGESILMCFDAGNDDVAWDFVRFCTPREAGLEQDPPQPASYVRDLGDVAVLSAADVEVSRALVHAHDDGLEPAIRVALRRAERNYRLCTPAYDPNTDQITLLLPLCLDGQPKAGHAAADCALVLSRTDGGGYRASAVVSLERAAACARVVSLELPRWLQP